MSKINLGEKVYVVRSKGIDLKEVKGSDARKRAELWASKNVKGWYSIYSYYTGV